MNNINFHKLLQTIVNLVHYTQWEGKGSRIRIALNGKRAVFHKPYPLKETDKEAIASMKRFLKEAGIDNVEL